MAVGKKAGERAAERNDAEWSVYLVRCGDGSLYTGVATDVHRRFEEHVSGDGRGAKYLRGRGPLQLVLWSAVGERGAALRVEARIKRLSKRGKEQLLSERGLLQTLVDAVD